MIVWPKKDNCQLAWDLAIWLADCNFHRNFIGLENLVNLLYLLICLWFKPFCIAKNRAYTGHRHTNILRQTIKTLSTVVGRARARANSVFSILLSIESFFRFSRFAESQVNSTQLNWTDLCWPVALPFFLPLFVGFVWAQSLFSSFIFFHSRWFFSLSPLLHFCFVLVHSRSVHKPIRLGHSSVDFSVLFCVSNASAWKSVLFLSYVRCETK